MLEDDDAVGYYLRTVRPLLDARARPGRRP
jgi:hypothetical protein